MHALAPNACTMLNMRSAALTRPSFCQRFSTRINVATCRPKVLQSLDLHDANKSEVEGLGIIPESWGTPAGRLLSQGEHVCDLDALKHLGISCEAGPIVLGRDHFYAALLSTVFGKLQRHHVGSWLLEAAVRPDAAAVFDAHPQLKEWVVHLAEQRFGHDGFLLVQADSPAAAEAASQLQALSACFSKELHNIPVAFSHDTAAAARALLLSWLLDLPDALVVPAGQAAVKSREGPLSPAAAAAAAAAVGPEGFLTASQDHVRLALESALCMLPYKPSLVVKQLPDSDSAGFRGRVQSRVPAAAALAAAASRRAVSAGATESAAAAGWVDGRACVCVAADVLSKDVHGAAFVVLTAAMQGLDLSSRQCAAAFEAVEAAAAAMTTAAPSTAAAAAAAAMEAAELRRTAQQLRETADLAESECLAKPAASVAESEAQEMAAAPMAVAVA